MKKFAFLLAFIMTVAFVNAQTRTEVKQNDLPNAITQNITKDFTGFTIQKAFKVMNNNVTSWEVTVYKGSDKERLFFDANGVYQKKEPIEHMANAQQHSSKPASASKH
jgi:hypothetical protein